MLPIENWMTAEIQRWTDGWEFFILASEPEYGRIGGDKKKEKNKRSRKKPALTRVERPTPVMFLWLMTLTFDLLIPKLTDFQDSLWNISVSGLVIPAASVFDTSCGKTDRQTNAGENLSRDYLRREYETKKMVGPYRVRSWFGPWRWTLLVFWCRRGCWRQRAAEDSWSEWRSCDDSAREGIAWNWSTLTNVSLDTPTPVMSSVTHSSNVRTLRTGT